jgi:hypothetical protein
MPHVVGVICESHHHGNRTLVSGFQDVVGCLGMIQAQQVWIIYRRAIFASRYMVNVWLTMESVSGSEKPESTFRLVKAAGFQWTCPWVSWTWRSRSADPALRKPRIRLCSFRQARADLRRKRLPRTVLRFISAPAIIL